MNVTMIGLGKLGMPVAESMSQHHTVRGYDITPGKHSDHIEVCDTMDQACANADIVFIAVPTPHDPGYGGESPTSHLPVRDFDYQYLESALRSVAESAPPTTLIVNISTVLPGTLRHMISDWGIAPRLCYNPYLIGMGTVQSDFEQPDISMMGWHHWPADDLQPQVDLITEFYASVQRSQPHITHGTWEEAECIKIFHNTYLTTKLVIANMIQDVTDQIGHANPSRVAESLRHAERITSGQYMEPGMGDGGPCHPRDCIALSWLADRVNLGYDLFHDIMRVRESQARRVADRLCAYDLPIHIMGRAFKPGVQLRDGSPAELVAHYCAEVHDRTVEYDSVSNQPAVYLLAHDRTYDEAWCAGSIIIDMYRRYTTDRRDIDVVWYGVRDGEPPLQ